jgi:hypothetical protein
MTYPRLRQYRLTMLLMALPLLSCCATGPALTDGCEWTKAIRISPDDVFTDGTAKQVLTHNKTGAEICGWKKSKRGE